MTTSIEGNDGTRTLSSLTTAEVGTLLQRLTQSSTVSSVLARQSFTVSGKDLLYLTTVEDLLDLGLGEVLPKFKLRKLIEELLILQKEGVVSVDSLLPICTEAVSVVVVDKEEKTISPKDPNDNPHTRDDNDLRSIIYSLVNRKEGFQSNYNEVVDIDIFCAESPSLLQSYFMELTASSSSSLELEVLLDLWYTVLMFGETRFIPQASSVMSRLLNRNIFIANNINNNDNNNTDSNVNNIRSNYATWRVKLAESNIVTLLLENWCTNKEIHEEVWKRIALLFIAMLTCSNEEGKGEGEPQLLLLLLSGPQRATMLARCIQAKEDYESQDEVYFVLTVLHRRLLLCGDGGDGGVAGDALAVLERDAMCILELAQSTTAENTLRCVQYVKLVVCHWLQRGAVLGDKLSAMLVRMVTRCLEGRDGDGDEKEVLLVCSMYVQLVLSDNGGDGGEAGGWPALWATYVLTSAGSVEVVLSYLLVLHHLLDRDEAEEGVEGRGLWSMFGTTGMLTWLQLCCDRLQQHSNNNTYNSTSTSTNSSSSATSSSSSGGDVELQVTNGMKLVLDLMLKMPVLGLPSSQSQPTPNPPPASIVTAMQAMLSQLQQQHVYSRNNTDNTPVYVAYTAFHNLVSTLFAMITTSSLHKKKTMLYKKLLLAFFTWMQIPVLQRLLRDSHRSDVVLNGLLTCSCVFATSKAHDQRWLWLRLRFIQMLIVLLYQNKTYQEIFWSRPDAWLMFMQHSLVYFQEEKELQCGEDVFQLLIAAIQLNLKTPYNVTQPFKGLELKANVTLIGGKVELADGEGYVVDDILGVAVPRTALQFFVAQLSVPLHTHQEDDANVVQRLLTHIWTSYTQHFPCPLCIAQVIFLLSFDVTLASYMLTHWQLAPRLTQAIYQYSLTALFPVKKSKSPLKPNLNLVLLSVQLATMAMLCKQQPTCIASLETEDIVVMHNPTNITLARLLIQILRIYPKDMVLPCYYVIFYTAQDKQYAYQFTRVIPCFLDSNRVAELPSLSPWRSSVPGNQAEEKDGNDAARIALKEILLKTSFRHKYILFVVLAITLVGLLLPHVLTFKSQLLL